MINVTCAIIVNDQNKILVTQRSILMPLPLKWEFPGGKIEQGETEKECLRREIKEELGVEISILNSLKANVHTYGTKTIKLIPFVCKITSGEIHLKEHAMYNWLDPSNLLDLDWAEADIPIVKDYINVI